MPMSSRILGLAVPLTVASGCSSPNLYVTRLTSAQPQQPTGHQSMRTCVSVF